MKQNKTKILIKSALVITMFAFSVTALAVWTPPVSGTVPPNNNTPSPVHVGGSAQYKTGTLLVGGFGSVGLGVFQSNLEVQGNTGLGVVNPSVKLDVAGQLKLVDGTQGDVDELLVSDGTGLASWKTASELGLGGSGGPWTRTGTNTHLTNSGDKVGIGTSSPAQQLEITGSFQMPNTTTGVGGVIFKGVNRFFHNNGSAQNVFVGALSGNLSSNLTGGNNTALGASTLYSVTTGNENVAVGANALYGTTTGYKNTALGQGALNGNTTGYENIGVGKSALSANTSGFQNVGVGISALSFNTTGSKNTAIGYQANVASGALTNATAIGNGASANASNKIVLGNASATTVGGYGAWTNYSDLRLKENVKYTNDLGLEFISKLKTASYNYSKDENKVRRDGLIAQDVQKALKELDLEFSGLVIDNDEMGTMNLSYDSFVIPLINAVQEQQVQIEELENKNLLLEERMQVLESKLEQLLNN